MPKKVLIITTSGGMGHIMAAKAIEQAFGVKYPKVETRLVNIIDYTSLAYQRFFDLGYEFTSTKVPFVWKFFYNFYKKKSRQKFLQMLSKTSLKESFFDMINEFQPDVIVSTHPLPQKMISASKNQELISIPSVMVLTDFGCHSVWVDDNIDYYAVSTNHVKQCLIGYGVNEDKILISGVPIRLKFTKSFNKDSLIKKNGLNPDLQIVLIVGGQLSFGSIKEVIDGVAKKSDQVQFLVVAGRDHELEKKLNKSNLGQNSLVKIFGFVDGIEELMMVSDIILSKAGGVTSSECMALGLPMIVEKVIPGQEEDNINYLSLQGAAIRVKSSQDIINSIGSLLADREKIQQMQQAATRIGRPDSATAVVDFVIDKIK